MPTHVRFFLLMLGTLLALPMNLRGQSGTLLINEIMAVNNSTHADPYKEFDDWVEIYNPQDTAISLIGWYLSDDPAKPGKHQVSSALPQFTSIPPKGHLLLWFDKGSRQRPPIHLQLKLSGSGETILLSDPDGKLADKVTFSHQRADISYARKTDGASKWIQCRKPTPAGPNVAEELRIAQAPVLTKGGWYAEPQQVSITGADKKATIRYTLDGTIPTEENGRTYSGPFQVDTTTVVTALVSGEGLLPATATSTFFMGTKHNLPVVSLSTDHVDVLTNTDAKFNVYSERPMHIECYSPQGELIFAKHVGFRLVGKAIKNYPQKSIAIRTRSKYGSTPINVQLFKEKQRTVFHDLLLRNSGNDNPKTLFRDGMMHRLVSYNTAIDFQGYQPAVVYVNGKYWGIHNLREKISKYYVSGNHPKSGRNPDIIEWKQSVVQGDNGRLLAFYDFMEKADFTNTANYDTARTLMDMDNFIDYQLAEIYFGNTDWPMANMKLWRPGKKGGKWRWILFDVDLAFDLKKRRCPGHHNSLAYALGENNCHLPHLTNATRESTMILRQLMVNPAFRERFLLRACDLLNVNFSPIVVNAQIDQIAGQLEPEMLQHIKRWGGQRGIRSMQNWKHEVEHLKKFATERADTLRKFFIEQFDLPGTVGLSIQTAPAVEGTVKVNSISLPAGTPFQGVYFAEMPIEIVALPAPGYKFVSWEGLKEKEPTIRLEPEQNIQIKPIFKPSSKR